MGQLLFDRLDDFAEGFVTSVQSDVIPDNALPRMKNACLDSIGLGTAILSKRRGMSTMNATPVSGASAVIGNWAFFKRSGATLTQYHLLVSAAGRLDILAAAGTTSNISTSLTAGSYYPDFAEANNLAFLVNGQDLKKTNGLALYPFGFVTPTLAPTIAGGAAGNHTGTYEARVTFIHTRGTAVAESSAGPTSSQVTVAAKQLDWTSIPTGDAQVTGRKLYLRNTSTQANFYLVTTINDNTTTTYTDNLLDSALVTPGPDTAENNPPLSGQAYVEAHRSRLFTSDGTSLYYSKVDEVEAFDPDNVEPCNPDDGQRISALHSAHDVLMVFKTRSLYALYGDDPQSWTMRLIDPQIGCTSHRSVVTVEGLTYWWSEQGPMVWDGAGLPQAIGQERIAPTIGPDALAFGALSLVMADVDFPRQRLLFAVPEIGQTKATQILPYNYRLQKWEGTWDPLDVASLGVAYDDNSQPWLFVGGHSGQVFKWWNADHDGVDSGTTTGTFVAAGTSVTTVTDLTAAFLNTGGKLTERKVTILDSTHFPVGSTRQRITSNDATSFTLATAVTGLTNGATYTYIVGGPDFQVDTKWMNGGLPFHKKRFEFLHVQAKATASSITTYLDLAFDYNTSSGQSKSLTFITTAPDATWDASVWDAAAYGTQATVTKRLRVGRTGRSWRARFRNPYANQTLSLQRLGMTAEALTTKS